MVVDKGRKFLFVYPLPIKEAIGMARKFFELLLMFGMPLSIRRDSWTELMAEMVNHAMRLSLRVH